MPISSIATEAWRWFAETGINLALLIVLALLVPRAGRFANRIAERRAAALDDNDESKSHLAIAGVGIYIAQSLAFFLILVFFLQQIGFSLAGAAIPATVVSAAVGFGAQSIIADFLAGFFILTEKQYGVGDNVTFEGNGINISGDVIQITMRATQIRTLEQATVSIPNSTARICINKTNYWSNAVVVIPVPLLGSDSADQATSRSEAAVRQVLARADIRPNIRGDLAVHPAVEVNPPATVGMPWTMDMRFMVRVEPQTQWMVERAIRVAILNEFWEEYGSATTIEGTRLDHIVDGRGHSDPAPTTVLTRADHDDARDDATIDDPAAENVSSEDDEEEPKTVFGGLMRASTGLLLVFFAVLLIVRGLTFSPDAEGAAPGRLAPPPRTTTSTSTSLTQTTSQPEPTPTQSYETPEQPTTEPPASTVVPEPQVPAQTTEMTTETPTTAPEVTSTSEAPTSQTETAVG